MIDDKNAPVDILESLYTLRIRESDPLKTVLALYDKEIHQEISRLAEFFDNRVNTLEGYLHQIAL